MQQKIIYKVIFNRMNRLNKDGKAIIQIEAYLNRKRRYFSTGIYIKPDEWDNRRTIVSKRNEEHTKFNFIINQQIKSLEDKELEILKHGKEISLEILSMTDTTKDFYEYFDKYVNENRVSNARKILIRRVIKYLKEYNSKLTFRTFKYAEIVEFDDFLRKQKMLSKNSIANQHKVVKAFLNYALKSDIIEKNPYFKFKIQTEKVIREFLTKEEIEKISQINTNNNEHLEQVKDMFLFSCYTGLRFSDVQAIIPICVEYDDDSVYLSFKQIKTAQLQNRIPVHLLFNGKAVDIINKYLNVDEKYIFPQMTNQEANRTLKSIQVIADIRKNLTFHLSRHTFGTQLAKSTNDPFLIKELMGHGDIKTSMIYIHLNNQALDDKLKNVKW
jgi:site-specific recombinase XerD